MSTAIEQRVPPLEAGDRLTREEFLRRWEAHPEIKKAELLGGIVYMPSPVSMDHGATDSDVGAWLANYRAATPGTSSGHNTTALILGETPQPDVYLRILQECGGSWWSEGQYVGGAPD